MGGIGATSSLFLADEVTKCETNDIHLQSMTRFSAAAPVWVRLHIAEGNLLGFETLSSVAVDTKQRKRFKLKINVKKGNIAQQQSHREGLPNGGYLAS